MYNIYILYYIYVCIIYIHSHRIRYSNPSGSRVQNPFVIPFCWFFEADSQFMDDYNPHFLWTDLDSTNLIPKR